MKRKLYRTILSLAIAFGAVLAVRWTIRTAMARAYRGGHDVTAAEVAVVPAPKVWTLAQIVPKELHINIGGLVLQRSAERLHMPYALAVEVADERAKSDGWERLDNPNAVTLKNLSGMERLFMTPDGSVVLREVRAIRGDDSIMEDLTIPAGALPNDGEQTTLDAIAHRSAARVRLLLPPVLRDVVVGSPMMTELIERGGGAALIVRSVSMMAAPATARAIESAARKAGWTETMFAEKGEPVAAMRKPDSGYAGAPTSSWTKKNLTFHFDVVSRDIGGECDVNYRFTDDESFTSTKGNSK